MQNIDDELKRIQLERERLALSREQALHRGFSTATTLAIGAIALPLSFSLALTRNALRLLLRWWPVLVLLALLATLAGGVWHWYQADQEAQQQAAAAQFERDRDAFIAANCPDEVAFDQQCEHPTDANMMARCTNEHFARQLSGSCTGRAYQTFMARHPQRP